MNNSATGKSGGNEFNNRGEKIAEKLLPDERSECQPSSFHLTGNHTAFLQ